MVTESRLQQGTCSTRASTSCTDKRNPSRTTRLPNATLLRTLTKIRFRSPVSRTIGKRFFPVLELPRPYWISSIFNILPIPSKILNHLVISFRIIASFQYAHIDRNYFETISVVEQESTKATKGALVRRPIRCFVSIKHQFFPPPFFVVFLCPPRRHVP